MAGQKPLSPRWVDRLLSLLSTQTSPADAIHTAAGGRRPLLPTVSLGRSSAASGKTGHIDIGGMLFVKRKWRVVRACSPGGAHLPRQQ